MSSLFRKSIKFDVVVCEVGLNAVRILMVGFKIKFGRYLFYKYVIRYNKNP